MKKIVFILMLSTLYLFVSAQGENYNYVVTNTDTIFCNKINVGANKTRCKLDNGEKIVIANKNINQYLVKDNFQKRLPVYLNGKQTQSDAMMKLVLLKNGVSVYKYVYYNGSIDCMDAVFSYYVNGICVGTDKNPSFEAINNLVASYEKIDKNDVQDVQLVQK